MPHALRLPPLPARDRTWPKRGSLSSQERTAAEKSLRDRFAAAHAALAEARALRVLVNGATVGGAAGEIARDELVRRGLLAPRGSAPPPGAPAVEVPEDPPAGIA